MTAWPVRVGTCGWCGGCLMSVGVPRACECVWPWWARPEDLPARCGALSRGSPKALAASPPSQPQPIPTIGAPRPSGSALWLHSPTSTHYSLRVSGAWGPGLALSL